MTDIKVGQIVRVRSRQYLIEDVVISTSDIGDNMAQLACMEDDA